MASHCDGDNKSLRTYQLSVYKMKQEHVTPKGVLICGVNISFGWSSHLVCWLISED
jgi:hypothetical protein